MSNVHLFLAIATESAAESQRLLDAQRQPKPDGSPGFIVALDLEQRSYRHACLAVVFAGIFFEAVTYLVARMRGGIGLADQVGGVSSYWGKARALDLGEDWVRIGCERLQETRNDIVHEKCLDLSWPADVRHLKAEGLQDR